MRNLTLDNAFVEVGTEAEPRNHTLGDVTMAQLLAHHSAQIGESVFLDIQEQEEEFDGDGYF